MKLLHLPSLLKSADKIDGEILIISLIILLIFYTKTLSKKLKFN